MFVAELFEKGEFEFLAVEIALKVKQVRLDAALGCGGLNGGTATDVQDGAVERRRLTIYGSDFVGFRSHK